MRHRDDGRQVDTKNIFTILRGGLMILLCLLATFLLFGALSLAESHQRRELLAAFLAAVIHEGGHLLAMALLCREKMAVRFRLTAVGAEIGTFWGEETVGLFSRLLILAAGSLANFVLAAGLYGCGKAESGFGGQLFGAALLYGFLNLLPIRGLDGGGILQLLPPIFAVPQKVLSYICLAALWLSSLCLLIASGGNISAFCLAAFLLLECLSA